MTHNVINIDINQLNANNTINFIHSNIRSVNKNINLLESSLLPPVNVHLIMLSETWTNSKSYIPNMENYNYLHIPNNDDKNSKNHGGLILYYKNCYSAETIRVRLTTRLV